MPWYNHNQSFEYFYKSAISSLQQLQLVVAQQPKFFMSKLSATGRGWVIIIKVGLRSTTNKSVVYLYTSVHDCSMHSIIMFQILQYCYIYMTLYLHLVNNEANETTLVSRPPVLNLYIFMWAGSHHSFFNVQYFIILGLWLPGINWNHPNT